MNELNTRVFYKLLIIISISLIIPVMIIGTFSYMMSGAEAERSVVTNNINVLNQARETFEVILNDIDNMSLQYGMDNNVIFYYKNIMFSQQFSHSNLARISDLNTNIRLGTASKPYIQSIYIYYNNSGGYFLSSHHGLVNISTFSDNSWYNSFIGRSSKISAWAEIREVKDQFTNKTSNVLSVIRAIPIDQFDKEGAIVINLNPDYLDEITRNISKNNLKYFYVTSSSGNVLISNNTTEKTIPESMLEHINANNTGYYEDYYKGEKSLISYHSSKYYNWKYITVVPLKEIYDESYRIRGLTIIVCILSLIVGIILAAIFAKVFYSPIRNMIKMIRKAEKGEDIANIHLKNKDEYSFIAYNLLKGFLVQRNLQNELAIRAYKLKEAELLALQAQINPHFLYNTLESINWKSIHMLGEGNEISFLTATLADLLRYSIENPDILVGFKEEIRHAENYISMLSYRYRNRFEVKWDIDNTLYNCKTIKLILQPLIENAVYHGLREKGQKGCLKIRGRRVKENIFLTIIDNGIGMNRQVLGQIRTTLENTENNQYEHIGIFNVNQRLKLKFGTEYGMKINSRVNRGTSVKVNLPVVTI